MISLSYNFYVGLTVLAVFALVGLFLMYHGLHLLDFIFGLLFILGVIVIGEMARG